MLYESVTQPVREKLSKWEKFMLRMKQMGDGKAAVITCTIVIDRNGELECWTEPKCNRLENAPASLGALIRGLMGDG
jgi:hypothetical protein